jgi:hypothetical protein
VDDVAGLLPNHELVPKGTVGGGKRPIEELNLGSFWKKGDNFGVEANTSAEADTLTIGVRDAGTLAGEQVRIGANRAWGQCD